MKENEAPEKLYIDLFKGEFNVSYSPINNSIEYVHTEAFIEKACEYLNNTCRRFILTEKDIEDFKNFMKGE